MSEENSNQDKVILHLCADIGSDSIPYQKNGYQVICVGESIGVENFNPPDHVYGIIANPPCTHFSIARTTAKTPRDLSEGMRLVRECLRIIWTCIERQYKDPSRTMPLKFWMIENPGTGFLKWFLGKPAYEYSPHEFGADYTKRTALWGHFNHPIKTHPDKKLPPHSNSSEYFSITKYHNQKERMHARSMCYPGFAEAFFQVNQ